MVEKLQELGRQLPLLDPQELRTFVSSLTMRQPRHSARGEAPRERLDEVRMWSRQVLESANLLRRRWRRA